MSKNLPHQLVVRVSDELYERLREDAETYGRTVAQSARFAIEHFLRTPFYDQPESEGTRQPGARWWGKKTVAEIAREHGIAEHNQGPS